MALLTFVSSVLSTKLGPAKMCSSIPGELGDADAVRRLTNWDTCSQLRHVLFFHPDSPCIVDEFLHLCVLSPNSPDRILIFFFFSPSVFAYSVTLLIVTVLHAPFVPCIWYSTISDIPWFDFSALSAPQIAHRSDESDLEGQTVYGDAFRSVHPDSEMKHNGNDQRQTPKVPPKAPWLTIPRGSFAFSVASFTPAWAKQHNAGLTRGLHNPFNRPSNQSSTDHHIPPLPSHTVKHPARAITKPTFESRLHERDDDPFAAPSKHDAATAKVLDECDDKKRTLLPLSGFTNLPRWSIATTSSENCDLDRDACKRGLDAFKARTSDRISTITMTTTTAVLSPPNRDSVRSLFPHDVREEDWNRPLTKPPFKNGRGEGWTTAGATQNILPAERGRGR